MDNLCFARATSTPVGDAGALEARKSIFGTAAAPAISSTKSVTGHLPGAAGAMEAAFSVLSLRDGLVPEALNLAHPDASAAGLDLIRPAANHFSIRVALSNGSGFAGAMLRSSLVAMNLKPEGSVYSLSLYFPGYACAAG